MTKEDKHNRTSRQHAGLSRRSFVSALSSLGIGAGALTGGVRSTSASVGVPSVPSKFLSSKWSDPTSLGYDSREGVIEWNGVRVSNQALQQEAVEEEDAYEGVPLWNLYAWRVNQLDTPPGQSDTGNEDSIESILSGISAHAPVGPLVVSADLGEIAEEITDDAENFLTQTAADIYSNQIENDYPIDTEAEVCEGFSEIGWTFCSNEEDSYSNPVVDVEAKYSFEMEHTIPDDWLDETVTYRGLLVIQTYDTDVRSPLNKTFVVAGSVFPKEADGISILDDYDFVNTSRKFMKDVR